MSLPLLPNLPPLAQAAAGNSAIDVRTVLLVLALVGLAYALRQVSLLRAEIETLRTPSAPTLAPAPVAAKAAAAPAAAPVPAPAPLGPPTPGELVAIFAAVHNVFGGHARLVAVAPVPTSQVMWSLEGRREVFRSHQIR
ncbi:MAG TPA: hypothetical protein VK477_14760 [Acidobacteriota bacterium]|nr:hypothetical protein [Acidobacteriota bacterium]